MCMREREKKVRERDIKLIEREREDGGWVVSAHRHEERIACVGTNQCVSIAQPQRMPAHSAHHNADSAGTEREQGA